MPKTTSTKATSTKTTTPAAEANPPKNPSAKVVIIEGEGGVQLRMLAVATLSAPVPAAPNVLARANSLCAAHREADLKLRAGKPCRVRVPYTQVSWGRCAELLTRSGGVASAGELSSVATTDFVRYAQRRGWLVTA